MTEREINRNAIKVFLLASGISVLGALIGFSAITVTRDQMMALILIHIIMPFVASGAAYAGMKSGQNTLPPWER